MYETLFLVGLQPGEVGLVLGIDARHELDVGAVFVGEVFVPGAAEITVAPGPLFLTGGNVMICHMEKAGLSVLVVVSDEIVVMVAIKLIIGHINQIEKTEIARIIAIGLSFPGVTILKAHFLASGPAMNVSRIKPATIMIGNSPNAALKTKFFIPPVSRAIL